MHELANGRRHVFLYENWISDEGMPRVTLTPWREGDTNVYKVYVRTADVEGAETDAEVALRLYGRREGATSDSGIIKLAGPRRLFQRAAQDTFYIKCADLGLLSRLLVAAAPSPAGAKPSWRLRDIEVIDAARNTFSVFPCDRWFSPRADPATAMQTLVRARGRLLTWDGGGWGALTSAPAAAPP